MKVKESVIKEVEKICDKYKDLKTPLIMILKEIQTDFGYIPLEIQEVVSRKTGIPVSEIYGVVTFYSFFSLVPKGKYVIGVCLGTACYVKGSKSIMDEFKNILGISEGQTTEDGLFTLDAVRCIGACGIAPALSINGQVYSKVQPNEVSKILAKLRAEK